MERDPVYYLNGSPVAIEDLRGLPASWFEKVEYIRMAPMPSGWGPALYFYGKRGAKLTRYDKAAGMNNTKIVCYSVIRQFYSPNYEIQPSADADTDYRSTIYWNPIVRTDSSGIANVTYYNSDEMGAMQVVVEGITADGKLCRGVGNYKVGY
jgi:hypothetical protein